MRTKDLLLVLSVPTLIVASAFVAMQFAAEMAWSRRDFVLVWLLAAGATFAYRLATDRSASVPYRFGVGLAVATALVVGLGNAAVGFIGTENHPANRLYGGVLALGLIGAALARLRPAGLARTLFAMALAQFLVPPIALLAWRLPLDAGLAKTFAFNTVFTLLFAGAAALFLRAAHSSGATRAASV